MPVRVLIVDDQATFRSAARAVVKAAPGFEVVAEATSGEASIEEVARVRPDLVLMDVNLPGMDGLQATIRLLAERCGTVVLLLSTRDADEYSVLARGCGAAAYLTKSELTPKALRQAWALATTAPS